MTVENLPKLKLRAYGDVEDPDHPVLSYDWTAKSAHRAASHAHPRAHIICPDSGVYWVATPEGTWLVPAGLAIWIAPRVTHEVYSHGGVVARILFVDEAHAAALPRTCGTVKMTPMLDALIARTIGYGNDYAPDSPAARLARVMLDELAAMEFSPLLLPAAQDPRLMRVMRRFLDCPETDASFEDIAREAGASPRTLARLFRSETGMSFSQWRTNLVLAEALRRLEEGDPITRVAMDAGYSSPSSFSYMFRKKLGFAPGKYRERA